MGTASAKTFQDQCAHTEKRPDPAFRLRLHQPVKKYRGDLSGGGLRGAGAHDAGGAAQRFLYHRADEPADQPTDRILPIAPGCAVKSLKADRCAESPGGRKRRPGAYNR